MVFTVAQLDDTTVESAGALVAREHAAAHRLLGGLPESFADAAVCTSALQQLRDSGHSGIVVVEDGRLRAVIAGTMDAGRVLGGYLRLPADGFAVDPDLEDATPVLALLYGEFVREFVGAGVLRHYLEHVALPPLHEVLTNLGFRRGNVYAVRPAAPRPRPTHVQVRAAGLADFDTIARLTQVMNAHRAAPPIFGAPDGRSPDDLVKDHLALRERGARHLIASLDARDVGLLTIEATSPAPRLCPEAEPFIGPTATLPEARGRGVGHALVDVALDWAHSQGHRWVSVDFEPANSLSRPFWLGVGFRPTGYSVVRTI
ncbi:GNAT superfamily N-acetyltransferase [Kibdelosporangium banguiense]|uniref:GNAT superfamily N-acetyltransferase n=1 Tax=Kibdelosporangium banguiense TaxID=1365924 RepID=A0ABS4TYX8_9PSEU|nr:GNAT family N-acetyltransferase [Kibdelosporangium banguiense]MBP2329612.1 GNAT superfamily N-acetyltransferase [Kibdelosporangium banguiense]